MYIFPRLLINRRHLGVCAADFAVDPHALPLHRVGDMAVNIKRGCRRFMAYRSRQRFQIHTMFQRHGRKAA